MFVLLKPYLWLLIPLSWVISTLAVLHVAMTRKTVSSAIAWVGVIYLSPFVGVLLYIIVGVNRVRRQYIMQTDDVVLQEHLKKCCQPFDGLLSGEQPYLNALKIASDHLNHYELWGDNAIDLYKCGDEAYEAMLMAIDRAQSSVFLQSYIFDNDILGKRFVQALSEAQKRGVQVRVLIDSVGVKYSHPNITTLLQAEGIPHALFMTPLLYIRTSYANLRCHRKNLVVDGKVAFMGGMNIRQTFSQYIVGEKAVMTDTHFRLRGPIVPQLLAVFINDWYFSCGEKLVFADWIDYQNIEKAGQVAARCMASGPDKMLAHNHRLLMAACSVAQKRIMIQSPYFLPDIVLMGALTTAAQRGVQVDIVIPEHNNLRLVQYAMLAQMGDILKSGARVWLKTGTFDHSKLMTVDGAWSLVGSSNWDQRSLRLNFEIDLEVYDKPFSQALSGIIQDKIDQAKPLTLQDIQQQTFLTRLRNRVVWLLSPYL